jgi:hypothetical protein
LSSSYFSFLNKQTKNETMNFLKQSSMMIFVE